MTIPKRQTQKREVMMQKVVNSFTSHCNDNEKDSRDNDNTRSRYTLMTEIKKMPQVGGIEHQKDKYQPGRSVAVYEHRMVR